jgi:site-specific DNA recombinase
MTSSENPRMTPRNGHTLVVGIIARISGCPNQKEVSLEDQLDHGREVVAEHYDGPAEFRPIATKGKGERLDRPELAEIEAMLRSRELDLLVCEDIGRMVRGAEAVRLCGIAVDNGTRVIAPNDCIDTAEDSWEEDVIGACRDHVSHNAHTSKRLKQKLMNRFLKHGGVTRCEIYGYVKPMGTKTYDDWQTDPAATPIYQEWFRRLRATLNCSAVADWLNSQNIPTGKHSRSKTWDGATVRRLTRNPLLKGMAGRGFKHTVKRHGDGRRVSVRNPKGPRFKHYPHLAHVDPAEFDEVNALLDKANKGFGRKPRNGADPRGGVPRKRTRFPGQHVRCWYCGRQFVWGGNVAAGSLMCSGSRQSRCWNSVSFDGALAATKITEAITAELYRLDGFDAQSRALVEQARRDGGSDLAQRWSELEQAQGRLAAEKENLLAAITAYGPRSMFQEKLSELEAAEREQARERLDLERRKDRPLNVPGSTAELRRLLEEKFQALATDSPEFGDLLRQLVPAFDVYLVRLLDGGHLQPRAKIKLSLAAIVPDAKHVPGLEELLVRELTLDLFEPPQRERIREEAARLEALGLEQRQIAQQLPEPIKQAAVWDALVLHRLMHKRGLDSPYAVVAEPPEDYPKLCRHRNSKYRFQAADGYQRPVI